MGPQKVQWVAERVMGPWMLEEKGEIVRKDYLFHLMFFVNIQCDF